jgi:hypothetical protein
LHGVVEYGHDHARDADRLVLVVADANLQTWSDVPSWIGRAIPLTAPLLAGRRWSALISAPIQ